MASRWDPKQAARPSPAGSYREFESPKADDGRQGARDSSGFDYLYIARKGSNLQRFQAVNTLRAAGIRKRRNWALFIMGNG